MHVSCAVVAPGAARPRRPHPVHVDESAWARIRRHHKAVGGAGRGRKRTQLPSFVASVKALWRGAAASPRTKRRPPDACPAGPAPDRRHQGDLNSWSSIGVAESLKTRLARLRKTPRRLEPCCGGAASAWRQPVDCRVGKRQASARGGAARCLPSRPQAERAAGPAGRARRSRRSAPR